MPRTAPLSIIVSLAIVCAAAEEKPIAVKVVVVTMFERGADTGDEPGEFQYWVERSKLDRVILMSPRTLTSHISIQSSSLAWSI